MRLLVTVTFVRVTKILHEPQEKELDAAVRATSLAPGIGDEKVGALPGVCVYNFRLSGQLSLLAYRILDQESIKL